MFRKQVFPRGFFYFSQVRAKPSMRVFELFINAMDFFENLGLSHRHGAYRVTSLGPASWSTAPFPGSSPICFAARSRRSAFQR